MISWIDAREPLASWTVARMRDLPAAGTVTPVADLQWRPVDGGRHGLIAGSTGGWVVVEDDARTDVQALLGGIGDPGADHLLAGLWRRGLVRVSDVGVLDDVDVGAAIEATRQRYTLVLLLNTGCNLACTYCYLGHRLPAPESAMPQATALAAIEQALATEWDEVMLDFGEIASSWAAFAELADEALLRAAAAGKRVRIAVQTNGTTITPVMADALADWDAVVGISLDGPENVHDASRVFRSGAGSYARVVDTLDLLRARGVTVHLIATIAQHNVAIPEDVVAELDRHHPASFLLKPVLAEGEAGTAWDAEGVGPRAFADFAVRAIRHAARSDSAPLDQSATKFLRRLLGDRNGWRDSCTSRYCGSGRSLHVIDPHGRSHACPRFVDEVPVRSGMPVLLGMPDRRAPAPATPSLTNLLPDELRQPPVDCSGCAWMSSCGGGCTLVARDDTQVAVPMPDPHCLSYDDTHDALFTSFVPAFLDGRFREATAFNGGVPVRIGRHG